MAYYLNLFSPETYEAFGQSPRDISGFRPRQASAASRVSPGDKLVCYMTKLSRWIGILEVIDGPFESAEPIFFPENDPFVIRFRVKPIIWLEKQHGIPIHEPEIWDALSFTRGQDKATSTWTGKLRSSLGQLKESDGRLLEQALASQANHKRTYEVDEDHYRKLLRHRVRTLDKVVTVSVPDSSEDEGEPPAPLADVRESVKIQAMLAQIGARMGMKIWIPRNDRSHVLQEWPEGGNSVLNELPLNYDPTTIRTIEQIDVLWLKGRSMARAFEVEHTTSIYSGLLRMADLLALQPNMDIKLHIVAPSARRDKVFQEIKRPVFSLLDRGPLDERCTFMSYDSVGEIAKLRHLAHMSDSVLDAYSEEAE
jgi:hypothetical protein